MPRKKVYWKNREKCIAESKEWMKLNSGKVNARKKIWRAKPENKIKEAKYKILYRFLCRKEISDYNKKYAQENRGKITQRVRYNRRENLAMKLKDNLRRSLNYY